MALDVLDDTVARQNAALRIQRAWRGRNKSLGSLDTEERWKDAALHTKLQV